MKAMGLPLFAAEGGGSPAITAVAPEGIDAEKLRKSVKEKFDILLQSTLLLLKLAFV